MGVFGAITLVGGVFGDVVALALGLGLCAAAWNELRGGARLRRFDPSGARILGYNQIALGVMIIAYAAWSLRTNLGSSALSALGGSTGDPSVDAMVGNIALAVTWGLYGGLIVVGIVVPGLTAWYYFSREKIVRAFVERTPVWVVDTLRAAG
jgi:hypothetical protein